MANVSVSGIEGTVNEVKGVNDTLKAAATQTSASGDRISKLATEFASYNGKIVAEKSPRQTSYSDSNYRYHYREYDTWVITTGGLSAKANYLANKAEEINSIVDKISKEVADTQTIATAIQGYIDTIQGILENDSIAASISSTAISSAFLALGRDGVAKANLATNGSDINSRNFLDYDSIKDDEKLNGGLLSFEKQDDGSYLIKKDGESTGYYTTGLAAGLYMKTLTTAVGKEYSNKSSNLKKEVKSGLDDIKDDESSNKKVTLPKDNSTSKKAETNDEHSYRETDAIQIDYPNTTKNLTTEYKARMQDDLFSQALIGKQDYVVPEGKNLYVKDKLIAKSGDVLKYNNSSNNYSILSSKGTKQNLTNYSSNFLSNGVFKSTLLKNKK